MGNSEYFRVAALYANAGEEGLHLGGIDGPQGSLDQKRLSFYVDFSEGPPITYAICTGPGNFQEMVVIESNEDIVRVMKEYLERKP